MAGVSEGCVEDAEGSEESSETLQSQLFFQQNFVQSPFVGQSGDDAPVSAPGGGLSWPVSGPGGGLSWPSLPLRCPGATVHQCGASK